MAQVFEQKIAQLRAVPEHDDIELRESARETLRGFIDLMVIPAGDALRRVVANLGEMPAAAADRTARLSVMMLRGRSRGIGDRGGMTPSAPPSKFPQAWLQH
jgi:hypothetical protein